MKGKLIKVIGIIVALVLVASLSLIACAKPATPTATTPAATTPGATTPAATTATATTPAATKPATTTPAPKPAATVIKWKFQTHEGPDLVNSTKLKNWLAPTLTAMTDGRFTMDIFYTGAILPNEELVDGANKGVIDGFDISQGYFSGAKNMGWTICAGVEPFIEKTGVEIFEFLWDWEGGKMSAWHQKQWDPFGIKFFTSVPANGVGLICSKDITNLADVSKIIVRTHSGAAVFWEQLGARTTYIPGPEIYTGLQLGTADAATWKSARSFKDWHWEEVAKYLVMPAPLPWAAHQSYSSLNSWNKLPKDIQASMMVAWREFAQQHHRNYLDLDEKAAQEMAAKSGVKVIRWTNPADMAKLDAAKLYVMDWVSKKDASGAEYIGLIKDYLRYKGYIK